MTYDWQEGKNFCSDAMCDGDHTFAGQKCEEPEKEDDTLCPLCGETSCDCNFEGVEMVSFQCDQCAVVAQSQEALDMHKTLGHPATLTLPGVQTNRAGIQFPQPCPVPSCFYVGSTAPLLAQHMRSAHPLSHHPADAALNRQIVNGPDQPQKPMLTRERYELARAVLDALPPGYYVKCSECDGWYMGGKYHVQSGGAPICEKCHGGT